ncbi:Holliday junction branch migration protein RuvA [bacterium]|nr:Holliday junction branch migration protein RuvA [bacterium]
MIAALYGTVEHRRDDGQLELRCGPVVLELTLPVSQARELRPGDEAELFTHLQLSTTADSIRLYGFTSRVSRELFATLLTGPGVGPRVALALLELGAAGLVAAVRDGDEKALTSVKGVGPKLAKKIILELSEKVGQEFAQVARAEARRVAEQPTEVGDALDAVVALGYPRPQAEQALAKVRESYDGTETTALIRRMLSVLSGM